MTAINTHAETLAAAGLTRAELTGGTLPVHSPIDGAEVARIAETPLADMAGVIAASVSAFKAWRDVPAPRRGELVRLLGEELRLAKAEDLTLFLGMLFAVPLLGERLDALTVGFALAVIATVFVGKRMPVRKAKDNPAWREQA